MPSKVKISDCFTDSDFRQLAEHSIFTGVLMTAWTRIEQLVLNRIWSLYLCAKYKNYPLRSKKIIAKKFSST